MYQLAVETKQHNVIQSSLLLTKDKVEEVKVFLLNSNQILNVYVVQVDDNDIDNAIDSLIKQVYARIQQYVSTLTMESTMNKVERYPVVIDGVTHMMTDEQMGNLVVDITPEQVEAIKLQLARERGEPEPVLYDDELIGPTSDDSEEKLNMVIDIQARMSKGMEMINECTSVLEKASSGERLPYHVFMSWVERRRKLWSHWNNLKNECARIIGDDTHVWVQYFKLVEEDMSPYHTSGDTEEVDTQANLFLTQNDVMEELLVADLLVRE